LLLETEVKLNLRFECESVVHDRQLLAWF